MWRLCPAGRGARYAALLAILTLLIGCSTVDKELERADAYLAQGQHASALLMYRGALPRIEPIERAKIAEVHARIAECLASLGRPAEAFAELQRALEQHPGNITARLRLGELYLATGNSGRALQEARVVLHVRPEDVDALTISGIAYATLGNEPAAIASLMRAFELDGTRDNVAIALAELYARDGEMDAARRVLVRAAEQQPKAPEPRLALARLEESLGEGEAAEHAYRGAISAQDTPETHTRLAQFLQRAGRMEEAENVLQGLVKRGAAPPTVLADFEMISGRVVKAVQSYLGVIEERSPRAKRAASGMDTVAARLVEAELEVANTQAGRSPQAAAAAVGRARGHLDRHRGELDAPTISVLEAEIALAENDVAKARVHASAAVAAGPTSPSAHYVLGLLRYREGDAGAAQEAWLAAIEQNTEFVPAQLAIASLALEQKEWKTAEQFASAVVLEEPANLRALLVYARALAAQQRYEAAAGILARAELLDRTRPEPHIVAGEIALERGAPAEALVRLQQAVLLDPQSPAALDALTRVYQTGQITRPMLRKMERVALSDPASPPLLEVVARLYAAQGWEREAARVFERVLEIAPNRPSAAAALVAVYTRLGDLDRAAQAASKGGAGASHILEAVRAQQRQDVAGAIRHYEIAVRRGEHTGQAANNLAWLYAEQGSSLDRALHLARSAAEVRPAEAAFQDTLGMVHLKRREYSEAIDAFQRAISLARARNSNEVATFRAHLAQAYTLAGQPQDAAAERARARRALP